MANEIKKSIIFATVFGVRKDLIGNRVRIPDSSRCCKLL